MAELVDALDSKSSDFGRVGSIPTLSTENCDDDDDSNDVNEVQIIDPPFTSQAASWTTTVSGQTNAGADTSAFGWTYSNAKAGFGY